MNYCCKAVHLKCWWGPGYPSGCLEKWRKISVGFVCYDTSYHMCWKFFYQNLQDLFCIVKVFSVHFRLFCSLALHHIVLLHRELRRRTTACNHYIQYLRQRKLWDTLEGFFKWVFSWFRSLIFFWINKIWALISRIGNNDGSLASCKRAYQALHEKWSFPLRISSVNVTQSGGSRGFGHIYLRNP